METTGTTLSGYNGTHCNLLNTEFFEKYITEIHVKFEGDPSIDGSPMIEAEIKIS